MRRTMLFCLLLVALGTVLAAGDRARAEAAGNRCGDSGRGSECCCRKEQAVVIEASKLKELLETRADVIVLDVRPAQAYREGHIPGAIHVDVRPWAALARRERGLEDRTAWAKLVGHYGIRPDSTVVVYGAPLPYAARVWWLLRYLGVNQVLMLDGGLQAWRAAGYSLQTEPVVPKAAHFEPKFQKNLLATARDVLHAIRAGDAVVLDVRSEGEYRGVVVRGKRGGHIPKAVHLEWVEFLRADGRFKSPAELRELLTRRGVSLQKPVITYCQSGARASVGVVALQLAGAKAAKNYFGSWADWSAREELPVEK